MLKRRIIVAAVALLLLVGVVLVVWEVNDWPPIRLILKYGFPPAGGPTGNTRVIEGIEFVELKPGYFRIGSCHGCVQGDMLWRLGSLFGFSWGKPPVHNGGECPTEWIEIEQPIWFARTEVTIRQWERFEVRDRWPGDRDQMALDCVSWEGARLYCRWLSKKGAVPVRLPSEVEWEFGCRAGSSSDFCFGNDKQDLTAYAWFRGNHPGDSPDVATKAPNRWGLHDMHGNVWEFCEDTWSAPRKTTAAANSLRTRERPDHRVCRGGGLSAEAAECRSAARREAWHLMTGSNYGFRPVFTLPEDE